MIETLAIKNTMAMIAIAIAALILAMTLGRLFWWGVRGVIWMTAYAAGAV